MLEKIEYMESGKKFLVVEDLSKSFDFRNEKIQVLKNLSFKVELGKTVCLFGPNGTGKTTFLNIVAGITKPDEGKIVFPSEFEKPKISYLMQNYTETLLPWLDLVENVAYPLSFDGVEKSGRIKKVTELMNEFDIDIPKKYPYLCSGGEKQKACLLRVFVNDPQFVLLDEPFSALDFQTKNYMQEKLVDILKRKKTTSIIVTHDPDQSIVLSDRILVLSTKPATIIDDIEISFEKDKLAKTMMNKIYLDLKARLLERINGGKGFDES